MACFTSCWEAPLLFQMATLWLQTEVGTEVLSPRKPLVSVAYSQRADDADHATQADMADDASHLEGQSLIDLDDRWVNQEDLDHLDASDGDPAGAVFVDNEGQVGIGTASPLMELDVNGSVNATTYYGDGSHLTGISGTADNDWTVSGNHMYSAVPGSVGIGTSSPENKLHIAGDVKATTYYGDGSNLTGISGTTDNDWTINGDDIYHQNGTVGIGTASPETSYTLHIERDCHGHEQAAIYAHAYQSSFPTFGGTYAIYGSLDAADVGGAAIYGDATSTEGYSEIYGVFGQADASDGYGVYGKNTQTGNFGYLGGGLEVVKGNINHGVYGESNTGYGVYGINTTSSNHAYLGGNTCAGYFGGDVHINGHVGIGTTSPGRQLHIVGSNPRILIEASSINPEVNFKNSDDLDPEIWAIYKDSSSDDLRFYQYGDKVTIQNSTGNVGIGTSNPSEKLDVDGDININSAYKIGGAAVLSVEGDDNTYVGQYTGIHNTTGVDNTFVGHLAGSFNTEGSSNTFVGLGAGTDNQTGNRNTFIGWYAGYSHQAGDHNTFIGDQAGNNMLTGSNNTLVGQNTGSSIGGSANTLIGRSAGQSCWGDSNVFIGHEAGFFELESNKLYIANGRYDSSVLIYGDFATSQVGIGTTSPSHTLDVVHDATHYAYLAGPNYGVEAKGEWVGGHFTGITSDGIRAYSSSTGSTDGAVYAQNTAGNAGYFSGDVHITGTLTGGKVSLLCDHPLDPLNKTLLHHCIESPQALVVYKGKAHMSQDGSAMVQMPEYFVALTDEDEASINLTPVGKPFLTGAEWNSGYASFTIYGEPNREVFYTVYADRDDPVTNELYRPSIEDKGDDHFERGKLIYPEAYGYPKSMAIGYEKSQISQRDENETFK